LEGRNKENNCLFLIKYLKHYDLKLKSRAIMKKNLSKEFLDAMSRETGSWKGPFYYNRKDPRVMVPKMHPSLGWTLNFASPVAWVAILALIAIIAGSVFFGK
jgi:uncharacterized membrane protein